jgi:hypothetical protein
MSGGADKKERPSPSESATLYKVGTKKTGNDGNTWIIAEASNGVKRWKLHRKKSSGSAPVSKDSEKINVPLDAIDLTELKNVKINRNNSVLVPIGNKKQEGFLHKDGTLVLKMSSKYVSEADNQKITVDKSKITVRDSNTSGSKFSNYIIDFDHNGIEYIMRFFGNPAIMKRVNEILLGYKKGTYGGMMNDSLSVTKEHHYGDLVSLTEKIRKKLKKGTKYYMVYGQGWDSNYTDGMSVLEYNGIIEKDDKRNWHFNAIAMDGYIHEHDGKEDASIISFYGSSEDEHWSTGTGDDPVHLVTRLRKGFTPPKYLPKAQVLKV